jgi:chemotaxis protein CheC
MKLTAVQEDALIELLNIGFGRAAASLSQLTGHRVLLEVPHVTIHPIDEVSE